MLSAIPTVLMRGGTSKGLYFLGSDLPSDEKERNRVLLAAMGSPDVRQIDGVGGAHPLTSKVAVVGPSTLDGIDVDYLFLQVKTDSAEVSDSQNCGNLLAGVGPFALEQGLVKIQQDETFVKIRMLNTNSVAIARVQTPNGLVEYEGEAEIDGVPGSAAPILLDFQEVAGSSCGSLLPTGREVDELGGVPFSCVDNGMPVVLLKASGFGLTGDESPSELEANQEVKLRIEQLRLEIGPLMNLGDVRDKTVPKMTLLSGARHGGSLSTLSLIPHRVHEAIGVLAAASVAAACMIPGTIAAQITGFNLGSGEQRIAVEHPTGVFHVDIDLVQAGDQITCRRTALLRTARKLMSGTVFIPATATDGL